MRDEDVVLLTEWRNRFVTAFLNEFECDVARTRRWLRDFVGPDQTRILFMLDSPAGGTFGYMGLAYIDWDRSYGEADAIVRGRDVRKGLMADAIQTLLGWARGQLHLREIGVRVLSDNPALDFYKRVGFREVKRVPLRRTTVGADIRWVEDEAAAASSRHLVHMRLF
jgi:RimJ/RimL family protein N-acetyltransferase